MVKEFIDYLINYKLNNNLLYLDKNEIKHFTFDINEQPDGYYINCPYCDGHYTEEF